MNKPELPPCLVRLSLGTDADARAIRRAYARELKLIDQEADAAGFQLLREHYEAALQWRAWETWESEETEREDIAPEPAPVSLVKRQLAEVKGPPDAEVSPQDLAVAVFRRLVDAGERLSAAPDASSVTQWEQAIRTHLAADELVNLDARSIFEQLIVDWLAAGWVPGKEKLFAAAPEVFGWEHDRRRLQQFDGAHGIVSLAIDERTFFLALDEEQLTGYRNTIALLRASFEPDSARIKYIMASVEQLHTRFPHLMALSVSSATVAHWRAVFVQRGGDIDKVQQAALTQPAPEQSGIGFQWGAGIFAVIMILRIFGSPASPPAETSEQSVERNLLSAAPVMLDQHVIDAIGADVHYAFPDHTPPGRYSVSFDLLVDLQGKVDIIAAEPSAYPGFDEAVRQAILRAQPFANQAGKRVKFSQTATVH